MHTSAALFDELETALASGTVEQRIQTLARITDLFMVGADRFSDHQVGLFDDVLLRITARVEAKALAKLSARLAPIPNAPEGVIRKLAFHDDITVARPVLRASPRISEADLLANAQTKSQQHLLAISERTAISQAVTDVLVTRGDHEVARAVAKNSGARFSDSSFRTLVSRSSDDSILATHLGTRRDVPRQHFLNLLERASASVREKLIASNPQAASAVKDVVSEVAGGIRNEVRNSSADYAAARAEVEQLYQAGRLDETALYQFARARKFEHTVTALSLLCGTDVDVVERSLIDPGAEVALILAKFAGMSWTTAKAILLLQAADRGMSAQDLDQAMSGYTRLQQETARRVLGFYRTRRKDASVGTASS